MRAYKMDLPRLGVHNRSQMSRNSSAFLLVPKMGDGFTETFNSQQVPSWYSWADGFGVFFFQNWMALLSLHGNQAFQQIWTRGSSIQTVKCPNKQARHTRRCIGIGEQRWELFLAGLVPDPYQSLLTFGSNGSTGGAEGAEKLEELSNKPVPFCAPLEARCKWKGNREQKTLG